MVLSEIADNCQGCSAHESPGDVFINILGTNSIHIGGVLRIATIVLSLIVFQLLPANLLNAQRIVGSDSIVFGDFGPLDAQLVPSKDGDWKVGRQSSGLLLHNSEQVRGIRYFYAPTPRQADETEIETQVRISAPGPNASAGLIFDLTTNTEGKFRYWTFTTDGNSIFIHQRNRRGLFLTHHSALDTDRAKRDVVMKVVRRDKIADFYINGVRLTRITSQKLTGGAAGLVAVGKLTAYFRGFRLHGASTRYGLGGDLELPPLTARGELLGGIGSIVKPSVQNWNQSSFAVMPIEVVGVDTLPKSLRHTAAIATLSSQLPFTVRFEQMREIALNVMPERKIPSVFQLEYIRALAEAERASHILFIKFQPAERGWLRIVRVLDARTLRVVHSSGAPIVMPVIAEAESPEVKAPRADPAPTESSGSPPPPPEPSKPRDGLPETPKVATREAPPSTASNSSSDDEYSEEGAIHLGTILGVFYHEIGHALVNEFKLPVVGPQEDVADEYAAFTFTEHLQRQRKSETIALMSAASAYTYLAQAKKDAKAGFSTPWFDEHSPNLNRFSKVICILYGAVPEVFVGVMGSAKIPEHNRRRCERDYAFKRESWNQLLRPHRRAISDAHPGDHSPDAKGASVQVVYGEEIKEYAKIMGPILRELRFFEEIAESLSRQYVWRRDLKIIVTECGTINAFYSFDDAAVIMCYELMDVFGRDTVAYMTTEEALGTVKSTSRVNDTPETVEDTKNALTRYLTGVWSGKLVTGDYAVDTVYHFSQNGKYSISRNYTELKWKLIENGTWQVHSFNDDSLVVRYLPSDWSPVQYCENHECQSIELDVSDSRLIPENKNSLKVGDRGRMKRL